MTKKAWAKDQAKWQQFCQQHRPQEECTTIIQHFETPTWFAWSDASRWAVDVLIKEKPTVSRDEVVIYSTVEVDIAPACKLMEERN